MQSVFVCPLDILEKNNNGNCFHSLSPESWTAGRARDFSFRCHVQIASLSLLRFSFPCYLSDVIVCDVNKVHLWNFSELHSTHTHTHMRSFPAIHAPLPLPTSLKHRLGHDSKHSESNSMVDFGSKSLS
jgi:hypothetical protein